MKQQPIPQTSETRMQFFIWTFSGTFSPGRRSSRSPAPLWASWTRRFRPPLCRNQWEDIYHGNDVGAPSLTNTDLLLCCLIWAMGGGALAAVSRSITAVRLEFGQADFPLRTRKSLSASIIAVMPEEVLSWLRGAVLVGRDDHVAFGLAVVARALHTINLGQLVDDFPVFPVHGGEAVAPLGLLSLQISVMFHNQDQSFCCFESSTSLCLLPFLKH